MTPTFDTLEQDEAEAEIAGEEHVPMSPF
jgi:hypothetical protein